MRPYAEGREYSSIKRAGMILKRERVGMALVIEIKIFIQNNRPKKGKHEEKSESRGGQFFNSTMERETDFSYRLPSKSHCFPLSSPKNEQSLRLQF